jgi:hypothetical protein
VAPYLAVVSVYCDIVATAAIPAFFRRLSTGLSPKRSNRREQASADVPSRKLANRWKCAWTWVALLLQATAVLIALNTLSFHVGPRVVGWENSQLTSPRPSQWTAALNSGIALQSKDLAIRVIGDELTATYTVTAPAGSLLGRRAEADGDSNAGNDLVDNVLGDVTVAEFRYGFTGHQYQPAYLNFQPPTLIISTTKEIPKRIIDTVTVRSDPLRLYLHRQQLTVLAPDVAHGKPPVQIDLSAPPGAEVTDLSALDMRHAADGLVDLVPAKDSGGSPAMTFTLSEAGSGRSWQDGLRGVGGITIPLLDPLLSRLNSLFVYAVLWWGLSAAKRRLAELGIDDGGVIEVARRVICAIVVALTAVAGISFAFDVTRTPFTVPAALEAAIATWVGVSGSWRYAPPGLRDAVQREVAAALAAGKGIVTGGALGVDYWATQTALSIDPQRLKVILPTSFATYSAHYRRRAGEGVISAQQAEDLISQLEAVSQAGSLVEHPDRPQVVNVATYYLRNQDVVDVAGELLAFQVNVSSGTQDTVEKARLKGIPVTVFTYQS